METKTRTFCLGRLLITPNAQASLNADDVLRSLGRHACCDWGDCCKEDAEQNEFALDRFLRLFSVYHDREGVKFWIITEADRSGTTVLMPDDY
jgi:hypothetical protein